VLPLRDNVPTRTFPLVTVTLIAANVVVFLGSCVAVARFRELPWYEGAFTSMFMHGGWAHLLGNMLFLWIFGNNVEDALGKARYVAFYVLGGLTATAVQTAVTVHYAGASGESVPNIGASGAIAAVLGAYFVLLPTARVLTVIIFFLREVPAFVFLGLWFLFQLWQGGGALTHPQAGGGVAFFAHVGGFVFGMLAVNLFKQRAPLRPRW
jgi:membrane associated rhomboid family serine protease